MSARRDRFIAQAIAAYAVLALLWVVFSDRLLPQQGDFAAILWLSTFKGVLFVAITSVLFFFVLRAVPASQAEGRPQLLEALARGLAPSPRRRWLAYAIAVLLTVLMLAVRQGLSISIGERPLLILFIMPIILAALLGGLGPGLLATTVAALGVDYQSLSPVGSLWIAHDYDLLSWLFLIANGIAISVSSEVMRRSLAKLELNHHLLEAVISGTPDAIFIKDHDGRYLLANAAACGFVGKSPAEVLGHDDRDLFPSASAQIIQAKDRAIMDSGATHTDEEHLSTFDGKEMVFLVTKGPVHDNEGQVLGLFGISHDISERKRAETEIQRLNGELEQRVATRTAELQSANRELEELIYAITHNLRAPLRAMGGFAQALRESEAGRLGPEAQGHLEQIALAGQHMGQLLDGILLLSRSSLGVMRRSTVDLSAMAKEILEELAAAEPARRVDWQVEAGLRLDGDARLLAVALHNLLGNAWKYTAGGSAATIRVYRGESQGRPAICIADNGAGFDMAHAGKLYQPFQRLHRQDEFPGIGIGLATVQRIVHRHGGDIEASASPGQGATFCLYLPDTDNNASNKETP
jgi:PAS domain S-box-containing protein